jgi:hypothetical protein
MSSEQTTELESLLKDLKRQLDQFNVMVRERLKTKRTTGVSSVIPGRK